MYPVSQAFIDEITRGAALIAKAEILYPDLSLKDVIDASDIRVSVRDNVIRRTAQLVAVNDGSLTPSPDTFYFTNPIRCWMGVRLPSGAVEWCPTFTGHFDEPQDTAIGSSGEIAIPCRDRFGMIGESTLGAPLTLGAATRVQDAIRTLFELAGYGDDDDLYQFDDGGRTLGVDYTWEADRLYLEAAQVLAADFALELYCSPLGVAVLSPWIDPNAVAPVRTYRRGLDVKMLGFQKTWINRLKNRIIVVGEGGNGAPVRVELRDMNPISPGYNPPLGHPDYPGPLGDRPDRYASAGIISADVAFDVATKLLSERGLVEEQIKVEVPVPPMHEVHDVIEVIDLRTNTAGNWLLDGFELAHGPSASVLPARRVRPFA